MDPHGNTENGRTRVLLVDDHILFRAGLAALLRAEERVVVVGEAADGVEALELMRGEGADVVVMDIDMPRLDGIAATKTILAEFPDVIVIVLSGGANPVDIARAREAGALAYLAKEHLYELGQLVKGLGGT
jgi:DNA-binding NarL/FixJ family response regulator